MCDDDIEDELPGKKLGNNDVLLLHFTDKETDYKKYALFKYNQSIELPDEVKDSILGKGKANISDDL
jgi:hypothetical protein